MKKGGSKGRQTKLIVFLDLGVREVIYLWKSYTKKKKKKKTRHAMVMAGVFKDI